MKTGHMILSAAAIIPLLSSCASYQKTAVSEAWSIKPAFNVRHSTENPEAYYQLGRYYQGQNRYEQALAAYQKALAADSKFVEAYNGLGVIYSMQGRLQEAIEQFRLAAGQAPNAAHIHNNLGYALYLSGSYAEAASVLERAVALEPANQAAHANLALALDKAGGKGQPVELMAQASPLQPAEKAPLAPQEAQQARTEEPAPIPAPAAAAVEVSQAPQQAVVELPKVITAAERNQVPVVESHIQVVQLAPNVYELRERVEAQRALAASQVPQQALAQPKGQGLIMPAARNPAQPVQVVERRIHAVQLASNVYELRERVEAPVRVAATAPQAAKPFRVEVSNGNGVTGMARKVAGYLDDYGYAKARLTNQKTFQVPSSEIHYRHGFREEAQSLVATLPGHPALVQTDDLRYDISVRVVLGKDLASKVAYFDRTHQGKIRFARRGADS